MVQLCGTQPLQYIRRTDLGRATGFGAGAGRSQGVSSTAAVDFEGTVDPLPGYVKQTLPEGEMQEKNLYLLTLTELRARDDYGTDASDYVIYQGETYEVMTVQEYSRVLPHYECRIMRVRPEV